MADLPHPKLAIHEIDLLKEPRFQQAWRAYLGPSDPSLYHYLDHYQSFALTALPNATDRLRQHGQVIKALFWESYYSARLADFNIDEIDQLNSLYIDLRISRYFIPMEIVHRNTHLQHLSLNIGRQNSDIPISIQSLEGHKELLTLSLTSVIVAHKDFKSLANHCPHLDVLNLSRVIISKESTEETVDACFKNLTNLKFDEMEPVRGLIASCPRLDVLRLTSMKLRFLESNLAVLKHELKSSPLRGLGVTFISGNLQHLRTLETLVWTLLRRSYCPLKQLRLAPDSRHAVMASNIRSTYPLRIYHCFKINQASIDGPFDFESR